MRDDYPTAGEQDPDLHDGEAVCHPLRDLLLLAEQHPPRRAVPVGSVRAHPLHHLADQLFGELFLTARALDSELDATAM